MLDGFGLTQDLEGALCFTILDWHSVTLANMIGERGVAVLSRALSQVGESIPRPDEICGLSQ